MTKLQIRVGLAALVLVGVASAVSAGPVERACVNSARAKGNSALCGCVQKVADVTLSGKDQLMVAQFFLSPDKAEEVRMQSTPSANAFWDRYTLFGEQAEMACRG